MEAIKIEETALCRCGGQVRVFGPCQFAPRSHWGVCCVNDSCELMVVADTLEEAIDRWNLLVEPIHESLEFLGDCQFGGL